MMVFAFSDVDVTTCGIFGKEGVFTSLIRHPITHHQPPITNHPPLMLQSTTTASPFPPLADSIDEALSDFFGFDDFRRGQREVIESVVEGRDNVVVMPTGSGKSLCYMLPACVVPGLVVAVSPLIALMKDQAEALEEFNIPATFINSSLSWPQQRQRLDAIRRGEYKIVLVAPERFKSDSFMNAIDGLPVGLFAIDEAHCISQWGHDFRPDYLTLDRVRQSLGEPTTLALTATATPEVQKDIAEQLDLKDAQIVVSGFERPNLFFEVFATRGQAEKYGRLDAAIRRIEDGVCLVYCATRKQVEKVGRSLREKGHHPALYHGGMADQKRDEIQDAFMAGDAPLLVATNAFGMGVDKSDVRLIVHFNLPGSVEAYYQEAGRAGRDGEESHCLLLYNRSDCGVHEFFIENSHPKRRLVERVWNDLQRRGPGTHPLDADTIADHLRRAGSDYVHPWAVESALRLLERGGHVAFGVRNGQPWIDVIDRARTRELRVDWEALNKRRQLDESHLDHMVRYATGAACRQNFLVRYFSSASHEQEGCGHCDICCGVPSYGGAPKRETITTTDALPILIKKLLSGVARCRGRCGAHAVAGMLRGSKAKKILRAGLNKLSTYGLLSDLRQKDLVRLLDILQRLRLTRQDVHGCLHLTDRGKQVMTSSGDLPPDVEKNLSLHVDSVSDANAETRKPSATTTDDLSDTYLHTLKLANQGLDFRQIADKRGLTTQSVLRHFMVLTGRGYELDLEDQADELLLADLREAARDWTVGDPLKPLKHRLSTPCNYTTLKLNLAILLAERHDAAAE